MEKNQGIKLGIRKLDFDNNKFDIILGIDGVEKIGVLAHLDFYSDEVFDEITQADKEALVTNFLNEYVKLLKQKGLLWNT